jgi:hypothetical protein
VFNLRYYSNLEYNLAMSKVCIILLLMAMLIAAVGCSTSSGSREFIPGKGWVPND